jgi:enoyl-CoA hydratase
MFTDILIDHPAEHVLRITLNRPDARNALRTHLLHELAEAFQQADQEDDVRCVILTGGEKVFAAGADVREIAEKTSTDVLTDKRIAFWQSIRDFRKPLIAAVNGYCLGGGNELAMLCDIIVAGESAQFGQPEIKLGLIPGAGGTQRLTAALGKAKAMKYILTGEFISAGEALSSGLISEVHANPEGRAIELATMIASKSPIASQQAKEVIRKAVEGQDFENGLAAERYAFGRLFETEDLHEGIAAFLEKRQPEFKGR